jgi:hypothetical protein
MAMAADTGRSKRSERFDLDLCRVLHPSYWPGDTMAAAAGAAHDGDGDGEGAGAGAEPDLHLEPHLANVVRIEDVPEFVAARRHHRLHLHSV